MVNNIKMCANHMLNDICCIKRCKIHKRVRIIIYNIKLIKNNPYKNIQFIFRYSYAHKIILGLIFSCAGDALLNLNLFLYGMAMFSIAQIFYTSALGFKPLRLIIGIPLYLAGAICKLY